MVSKTRCQFQGVPGGENRVQEERWITTIDPSVAMSLKLCERFRLAI